MWQKPLAILFSAFALCAQTACVTRDVPASCTVAGEKYLSSGASADQICRSFSERLGNAMRTGENTAEAEDVSVTIVLHQRGSVEAKVTANSDAGPVEYPRVSVDVMDRPIAQKDLDKLADTVAHLLMSK